MTASPSCSASLHAPQTWTSSAGLWRIVLQKWANWERWAKLGQAVAVGASPASPAGLGSGQCCKHALVLCAARAAQAKTAEPQNALQVRKPHLDAFTVMPRLFERFGPGERPCDIAGALVDAAGNLAGRCMGAASGFHWAWGAVSRAAAVEKRDPVVDQGAARRQGGADIGVGGFVVAENLAREAPVASLGLVDDGDVRCDPLLLDQPAGSAASRRGLRPKRSSMVRAAPISAWRTAREASTSTMTPNCTSIG